MRGLITHMGDVRNVYKILVAKLKRPLGGPRHRCENNTKMYLIRMCTKSHVPLERVQ
jgi:hypothetical protein